MNTSELQKIKLRYNIVGNSDELNRALDVALQVAPTDLSVLIIGESGVGKEIIPKVIHDNSPRRREKYFAINCGSIPEGTIDSELFGHEKGSFTGAIGESEGVKEIVMHVGGIVWSYEDSGICDAPSNGSRRDAAARDAATRALEANGEAMKELRVEKSEVYRRKEKALRRFTLALYGEVET